MKVQDAISAYDFLSKLDWIGVIGFMIAAILIISFLVISIVDKIYDSKAVKRNIVAATILAVIICCLILKSEADSHYDLFYKANDLKQYMLESNEIHSGYIELATNANFPDTMGVNDRIEEIKKIIKHFPDEFADVSILYPNIRLDTTGVGLINTKTLQMFETKNQKLYPLYKAKLLYYMKQSGRDTLNYNFIRGRIDDRLDDNILDMIVSTNPRLFITIYATYDPYDKANKNNAKYGNTEALRISDDSLQVIGKKTRSSIARM